MSSQDSGSCKEKPRVNHDSENSGVIIFFAVFLAVGIVVASLLDWLFAGVPLGFSLFGFVANVKLSETVYFVFVVASSVFVGFAGLRELFIEHRFSVEFLMAVAALGAVYLGFLFEATTVLLLYFVAEYFEGYIQNRARRTVERLSRFMPDRATVFDSGVERSVEVSEVMEGTVILVKPGERIPLDGNIVEGFSNVDQALVTGESVPVMKAVNDCVYAGTLSTSGFLKIVVTKRTEDTLVSRIVKLVIESGKRKASMEKLVDRFAKIYVPIVIGVSVFTAVVLPFVFGGSYQSWMYRSLVLLVVSCPSAFIISVPATVFVAITVAARRGVIIKGGLFVEKLSKVKTAVFDKTGTLTLGRPAVHEVRSVDRSEDEVLGYAAALDQFSKHPVAQAITRRAAEKSIDISKFKVSDVTEVAGKGIVGYVEGHFVAVGNPGLMKEFGCNCKEAYEISENDTHTSVCVSVGKEGLASVCVVDEVRQDAHRAIDSLKKSGIRTLMLTGDRSEIAKETASELEIDEVHSDLFPEDKLRIVESLKRQGGVRGLVAMIGDGVNDAPALAASDVGIAMGAAGVDVALESADVVLVKDELSQIPYLIRLSEKTMEIAEQNIVASLGIKLVLGALGVFGLTGLLATVIAGDDGVTLLLLLNTLRLGRVK